MNFFMLFTILIALSSACKRDTPCRECIKDKSCIYSVQKTRNICVSRHASKSGRANVLVDTAYGCSRIKTTVAPSSTRAPLTTTTPQTTTPTTASSTTTTVKTAIPTVPTTKTPSATTTKTTTVAPSTTTTITTMQTPSTTTTRTPSTTRASTTTVAPSTTTTVTTTQTPSTTSTVKTTVSTTAVTTSTPKPPAVATPSPSPVPLTTTTTHVPQTCPPARPPTAQECSIYDTPEDFDVFEIMMRVSFNKEVFSTVEYDYSCRPLDGKALYVQTLCTTMMAAKRFGFSNMSARDASYLKLNRGFFFNDTCRGLELRRRKCPKQTLDLLPKIAFGHHYGWDDFLFKPISAELRCNVTGKRESPRERLTRSMCENAYVFSMLKQKDFGSLDLFYAVANPAVRNTARCIALTWRRRKCFRRNKARNERRQKQ